MEHGEDTVAIEHRETSNLLGMWVIWFDSILRDGRRTTGFYEISPVIHEAVLRASATVNGR